MEVNFRVKGNGLLALRESAQLRDAALVEPLDMLPGTGDGQFVQQFEKCGTEFFKKFLGFAVA